MAHEAGVSALDSRCSTGLAQILTWEARCDQVHIARGFQLADVPRQWDARKALFQHLAGARIDLAKEFGKVSCLVESELDTTYSSKQPGYVELLA